MPLMIFLPPIRDASINMVFIKQYQITLDTTVLFPGKLVPAE
jgi:hypothetical protein